MNHRPVAVGLVVCEQVIVEEGTHNVTPVNCFNLREVEEVPGQASFYVLAWLADGMGEMSTELVIERLDNLEEIFRIRRDLVFPDRLRDMRFAARIRRCNFPVAGHYQVSLIIDGELVAARRFRVQRKGDKQ